jgi:hypothetical protein
MAMDGGQVSVLLRTPPGSAQSGATLNLAFNIPGAVTTQLNSVNLTALVNGMVLHAEEYKKAGPETLSADVRASLLATDSVKVDFVLDKSLPPGADKRDLGIIATSVGLWRSSFAALSAAHTKPAGLHLRAGNPSGYFLGALLCVLCLSALSAAREGLHGTPNKRNPDHNK